MKITVNLTLENCLIFYRPKRYMMNVLEIHCGLDPLILQGQVLYIPNETSHNISGCKCLIDSHVG